MAERALAEGWLDVTCMTKTHIADPHFTRKVLENRTDDIRFCTRCLQSCHGKMDLMTCVYNPFTSRELEWAELKPAAVKKRIVIVGAGPAGMETAITAAARGHKVIVLERSDRVGGQVWVGAGSPLRQNWARIAEFYQRQARKLDVRLNTTADVGAILALRPDVAVLATGSTPLRMRVDEIESLAVHDVIAGKCDSATHVLLYDREGFNRPLVAADYLSSRGITVDFVTPLGSICPQTEIMMLDEMVHQLKERGVQFHPGKELAHLRGGTATIRDTQRATETSIDGVDALVATIGSSRQAALEVDLRDRVPELHVIGDANTPATVEAATYQGASLARRL
jgi:NADPH-dependent 2,4-dienoyl-CoA reductase/sulfur reductase-like enzyme